MSAPDELKHDPESALAPPRPRFYADYLQQVDTKLAFIPLLVCCFLSGLTDATIYKAYGTFVSMQTGNTIFLALGASGFNNKPYGWARSLCSIGFFVVGAWSFARLSRLLGGQRRGTQALSFAGQAALVAVAAALIQSNVVSGGGGGIDSSSSSSGHVGGGGGGDGDDFEDLAIIALLSFQAAGQIVASRSLKVGEIPTVVVTSLLCDLMSDPALLRGFGGGSGGSKERGNRTRDRRVAAFVLTLIGGVAGGAISRAAAAADGVEDAVEPALWAVAGLKFVLAVGWLFWPAKSVDDE